MEPFIWPLFIFIHQRTNNGSSKKVVGKFNFLEFWAKNLNELSRSTQALFTRRYSRLF